ncbi:MAG: WYL domain-containing protein [Krumholzibacteria bacterium]|nr:WYL domain-containing protein [Candidatus Krumholzibacteria bacterium]
MVLELTGWAADFARERVWSPDQRITELAAGGIRLEFWATSEPEVVSLVLGLGSYGRLRSPGSVVASVVDSLKTSIESYCSALQT